MIKIVPRNHNPKVGGSNPSAAIFIYMHMFKILGLIGAVILPLLNIPLILKIGGRRSAKDISLMWTVGVFFCLLLMLPSALVSVDHVFTVSAVMNVVCFGGVVIQVIRYR